MKVNKEWINISDMMSGLMMVFLFIAIAFMIQIQSEQQAVKEIAMTYRKSQQALNHDLHKEFEKDLKNWGAEITKENVFRFNSPEVLFSAGSSEISNKFKAILDNFFPRYIKLLSSKKYFDEIDEIRIEGHTSYGWNSTTSKQDIYLNNMQLSQARANNVLTYCYNLQNEEIDTNREWLEKKFRANGMSFAKLIYKKDGTQDNIKSRRVEFKVLTKAQEKIYNIVEQLE